jgi:hypothetical protein
MPKEMMPGHVMLPPFKYPEGEYERIFGTKAEPAEPNTDEQEDDEDDG